MVFKDVNPGGDEESLNAAISPLIAELNLGGHKEEDAL